MRRYDGGKCEVVEIYIEGVMFQGKDGREREKFIGEEE